MFSRDCIALLFKFRVCTLLRILFALGNEQFFAAKLIFNGRKFLFRQRHFETHPFFLIPLSYQRRFLCGFSAFAFLTPPRKER